MQTFFEVAAAALHSTLPEKKQTQPDCFERTAVDRGVKILLRVEEWMMLIVCVVAVVRVCVFVYVLPTSTLLAIYHSQPVGLSPLQCYLFNRLSATQLAFRYVTFRC